MTSEEKEEAADQPNSFAQSQAKASASSGSVAPPSPYRGTGYRSIAFGTWAVGDASRRFAERKRGRSSGGGQWEQGNEQSMKSQQPTTADANNTHEKKPRECETIAPLSSHSMGDIRPNSCTTTTTIVTMSMTERLKRSDLYSSSEYVRHSTGGNYDENVSMAASLPPLACCNRSMETLAASNCCAFNAASPVPSRISCPSSRPRFAFIVDPLKAGNRQQCQQQADASCTPSMRNRTKSLDNGLKFSSSTPQRSRKMHRNGNNNCAGNGSASIEPIRRKCHNDSIAQQQQHSRLEQAKQFLRRFYASSTLRLAGRKRKTMLAPNETNTRVEPNGALMFSSAVGPFFEFRPPCPEELPLLPYNIHYAAVHSADCSDDSDQDEEEDDSQGVGLDSSCPLAGDGDHSTATLTPAGGNASCSSSSSSSPTSHCQSARTSSSSGLGISTTAATGLPILDTSVNRTMQKCADSPDSALGGSPSGSASSGHPTVIGSHSLRSSNSEVASGRKQPVDMDMTAQSMASAERRFANWNELFQYLRREIVEMNLRDAQILHRLEGIQADLNGVRQLQRHLQGR